MRLLLPLALFAKSPSRMVREGERWRCVIPAACLALSMSCLILYHMMMMSSQSSQAAVKEKRRDLLASMCDERARLLQYQVNASMNSLQALAALVVSSAVDQTTFARYAERTAFGRPLTSGVVYGVRVNHTERQLFERRQGWSIKKMYSNKQSPSNADAAEVRQPAEEYVPIIFAQDNYKHLISLDLLSAGAEDRDRVLRARESGKGVLTAPFKLLNNRIGVILTYAVYKDELSPNARPLAQEHIQGVFSFSPHRQLLARQAISAPGIPNRTPGDATWPRQLFQAQNQTGPQSAIGYLGGIFDIEALMDKLPHQLAGRQSIMVNVYDTTYECPVSMYGSNDTGSGMLHVSMLNFGDPSRKHEMHCRFIQSPPWPWMAIVKSSIGALVIALLIYIIHATAKRIARVEDDYAKSQVISFSVELEQDEMVDQVEEKLDQAEMKSEEVGMRSKLITMVNKKLTSFNIHSLRPSRFCCLNRKAVRVGLLGLMLFILVIGFLDLPFNQNLGIRREDENMTLNKFGWSHQGRLLISTLHGSWAKGGVENSDMITVGLREMTVNNDSSEQQQQQQQQQQTLYSHMSSKHKEEASTEMQHETVKRHLPTYLSHKTTTVGLWIVVVSVIVLVLGVAVWLLLWCNRRKRVQQNELELSGGIGPRRFQLCELAAATSNFRDDNKLGQGGFGPVYKGYLRNQDCHVAIKVLSKRQPEQERSEQGLREFKAEVKVLNQLRHRNIVKLVGWCDSENRLMLVYELMAQGSLDKHLYDSEEVLTWQQRYRIVLGVGSGLIYLHRDCEKCIVHGDIKPANIMLDASYNAKLGDFGMARLVEHGEQPQTTQVVAGTLGYIDPEFLANRWPRAELDVYSFGVVLLEIACGKRPASRQPNGASSSLLAWVNHLYRQGMILGAADERLDGEFDRPQMERVLVTGLWCAHRDPVRRPSVEQAMDVLRSADAELPVLCAGDNARRHVGFMEEQAYGDLQAEDHRPVHAVAPSTYFTSKDSAYLLAQE